MSIVYSGDYFPLFLCILYREKAAVIKRLLQTEVSTSCTNAANCICNSPSNLNPIQIQERSDCIRS